MKRETQEAIGIVVIVVGIFFILSLFNIFANGRFGRARELDHSRAIIYTDDKSKVDRGSDPRPMEWTTSGEAIVVDYPCSWSIESDTKDVYLYVYDEHSHLKMRLVNPSKVEVVRGK